MTQITQGTIKKYGFEEIKKNAICRRLDIKDRPRDLKSVGRKVVWGSIPARPARAINLRLFLQIHDKLVREIIKAVFFENDIDLPGADDG